MEVGEGCECLVSVSFSFTGVERGGVCLVGVLVGSGCVGDVEVDSEEDEEEDEEEGVQ